MVQVMKTETDNHRSFRGINIRNSKAKTNEWVIIHFHLDVKRFDLYVGTLSYKRLTLTLGVSV